MNIIRGTSGAVLTIMDDRVVKTYDGRDDKVRIRLQEQADFMQTVGTKVFPAIYDSGSYGYTMERMDPVPTTGPEIFDMAFDLLGENLWCEYDMVGFGDTLTDEHVEKMNGLMLQYLAGEVRVRLLSDIRMRICHMRVAAVARIHGDPTFENMCSRNGELRMLDPIPASSYIPPLMAVDVAKMMQSALGYEKFRGNAVQLTDGNTSVFGRRITDRLYRGDYWAAHYFLCVHFIRLLPYQPPELFTKFTSILDWWLVNINKRLAEGM